MATVLLVAIGASASGLADGVKSGPANGETVRALPVYLVTGDAASRTVDLAAERGKQPTVYLFIRADAWGRPMARVLRGLDEKLAVAPPQAEVIAVWVGGNAAEAKETLPRARLALNLKATRYAVDETGAEGPEGWRVSSAADVTAVATRDGRVVASLGFTGVDGSEAARILEASFP
jgi:hypothetical protein